MPIMAFSQIDPQKNILYEGTEVSLSLNNDLNGKEVKVGEQIEFKVSKDVIVNDKVMIKQGCRAVGTITDAARSKALGKKGKLEFSIDYIYLPGGKPIKLKSSPEKADSKGRGAVVATTAVLLSPLALFIKGKQAKIAAGTIFTAYIDHDIEL